MRGLKLHSWSLALISCSLCMFAAAADDEDPAQAVVFVIAGSDEGISDFKAFLKETPIELPSNCKSDKVPKWHELKINGKKADAIAYRCTSATPDNFKTFGELLLDFGSKAKSGSGGPQYADTQVMLAARHVCEYSTCILTGIRKKYWSDMPCTAC